MLTPKSPNCQRLMLSLCLKHIFPPTLEISICTRAEAPHQVLIVCAVAAIGRTTIENIEWTRCVYIEPVYEYHVLLCFFVVREKSPSIVNHWVFLSLSFGLMPLSLSLNKFFRTKKETKKIAFWFSNEQFSYFICTHFAIGFKPKLFLCKMYDT